MMEEHEHLLKPIINGLNLKTLQGIRAIKLNSAYFIWLWFGEKVLIYETSFAMDERYSEDRSSQDKNKCELNLSSGLVDVYCMNEDSVHAIDASGVIYSFVLSQHSSSSQVQYMEVDDIFGSPTPGDLTLKWKEKKTMKIEMCDIVMSIIQFSGGLAVLSLKDNIPIVLIYSLPEFNFLFFVNLEIYGTFQEAVLSSCTITSLSPSLKRHFKDNIEVFNNDIIVIALPSGLVLWLCANAPLKGPFVLISTHQQIQSIHWIKDPENELLTHLVLVLKSGRVVVVGQQENTTLYLPDSVQTSWCLKHSLITSNFIDCYASKLNLHDEVTLECNTLPVKGVCAITGVPGSHNLLAATLHGSVYYFKYADKATDQPSQFVIPDQSLLDNMFVQTQKLERVYKDINEENAILKAISTAAAANNIPHLFELNIQVISDSLFVMKSKLSESGISFSHGHWMTSVEVVSENSEIETIFNKLKQDFSSDSELVINAVYKLSIGSVVSLDLISFIGTQQPLLVVPVGKIKVDACHLMTTHILAPNMVSSQEYLGEILRNLNNEMSNEAVYECKLAITLPKSLNNSSLLPMVLRECQHRISVDEWNKISGGKKYNIQLNIHNIPVILNLDVGSRELYITSCDVRLCYQVKESIIKHLADPQNKLISDNIVLDIQALYQTFEIERLREEQDIQSMRSLQQKLRSTISINLPI